MRIKRLTFVGGFYSAVRSVTLDSNTKKDRKREEGGGRERKLDNAGLGNRCGLNVFQTLVKN